MCSSVKFLRPQENKFLPFPSRTVLANEEVLIFWEVTPYAERKELWNRQSWSQTTKVWGEDTAFPISRAEDARREDEAIDPLWHLTNCVCPPRPQCWPGLSLPGFSVPGRCAAKRQIWTQTSCPVPQSLCFLVGCFVLFCGCRSVLFPLLLEQ